MVFRSSPAAAPRAFLTVEPLEDRQLLSVAVRPAHINIKSTEHGEGVFTVRLLSDTANARTLLQTPSTVTETFAQGSMSKTLTPIRTHSADVNGDGVADLILKFRRSDLRTFASGAVMLTVSNGTGTGAVSEQPTTFTLFNPGHQGHHHHGHHGHHGNGEGPEGNHHPGENHGHSGS